MIASIKVLFFILVLFRILSLFISLRNEKKLKAIGAVEYGKTNSLLMVIGHTFYYALCFYEGVNSAMFDSAVSDIGLFIYAFAIVALYIVIIKIRHVWTVKLIIASKAYHTINNSWLFKNVRHPNYYMNIIPELIGFALIFHAWYTLLFMLPLQLVFLAIRIGEEEKQMQHHFDNYL